MKVNFLVLTILFGFTVSGCASIKAPVPDQLPEAAKPKLVSSTIRIPIKIERESIREKFEEAIPTTFSGSGHGSESVNVGPFHAGVSYNTHFNVSRAAINLGLAGNSISVSTTANGSGGVVVPHQGLIPHTSVTATVQANVGASSKIDISKDWKIHAKTTPILNITSATIPVGFNVSIPVLGHHHIGFNVSVRDLMDNRIRPRANDAANQVTAALNAIDVRSPVEKVWRQLGKPIQISKSKSGWISVKPTGLYYSGFANNGADVSAVIGMDALIEGVYGAKPSNINIGALPPLNTTSPTSSGIGINLPISANYRDLRESLNKAIVGRIYETDKGIKIEVKGADLYGNGEKVVLMLDVKAQLPGKWFSTSGRIYFIGQPVFDKGNKRLSIQKFDYDLKTKNYLVKAANWLLHKNLRESIANELSWDLTTQIADAKTKANASLANVFLGNGVRLKGSISKMEVKGVYPSSSGIQIGAVFKGDASILLEY